MKYLACALLLLLAASLANAGVARRNTIKNDDSGEEDSQVKLRLIKRAADQSEGRSLSQLLNLKGGSSCGTSTTTPTTTTTTSTSSPTGYTTTQGIAYPLESGETEIPTSETWSDESGRAFNDDDDNDNEYSDDESAHSDDDNEDDEFYNDHSNHLVRVNGVSGSSSSTGLRRSRPTNTNNVQVLQDRLNEYEIRRQEDRNKEMRNRLRRLLRRNQQIQRRNQRAQLALQRRNQNQRNRIMQRHRRQRQRLNRRNRRNRRRNQRRNRRNRRRRN